MSIRSIRLGVVDGTIKIGTHSEDVYKHSDFYEQFDGFFDEYNDIEIQNKNLWSSHRDGLMKTGKVYSVRRIDPMTLDSVIIKTHCPTCKNPFKYGSLRDSKVRLKYESCKTLECPNCKKVYCCLQCMTSNVQNDKDIINIMKIYEKHALNKEYSHERPLWAVMQNMDFLNDINIYKKETYSWAPEAKELYIKIIKNFRCCSCAQKK